MKNNDVGARAFNVNDMKLSGVITNIIKDKHHERWDSICINDSQSGHHRHYMAIENSESLNGICGMYFEKFKQSVYAVS